MPKFHRYGNKVRNAIFFGFLTSVCIFLFILGELKESLSWQKLENPKKIVPFTQSNHQKHRPWVCRFLEQHPTLNHFVLSFTG